MSNMPLTPSTPVIPISNEWVNVEYSDCGSLDKTANQPPFPTTQRTQSFKSKACKSSTFPQDQSVMNDSCRSISNPDLMTNVDKERCSVSSSEIDLSEPSSDIILMGSVEQQQQQQQQRSMNAGEGIRNTNKKKLAPLKTCNSDGSLVRSDMKIPEGFRVLHDVENGMTHFSGGSTGGGGGKWKFGGKIRNRHNRQHREIQNMFKSINSSDNLLEQPPLSITGGAGDKEILRSSSGSPQDIHFPAPKKKNGAGIFKKKKKKNSSSTSIQATSSLQDDAFIKDSSPPPPPPSFLHLHSQDVRSGEQPWTGNGRSSPVLSTGDDLSPCQHQQQQQKHVVSGPIKAATLGLGNKEPVEVQFDLQSLVLPVNKNWVKCGYLWLRMKLPNGRYAWTHIVSIRIYIHTIPELDERAKVGFIASTAVRNHLYSLSIGHH